MKGRSYLFFWTIFKINAVFVLVLMSLFILTACDETLSHTVYFHTQIDEEVIEQEVLHLGKATPPSLEGQSGYWLEGWYTSLDDGDTFDEKWSFTTNTVGNNLNLYANWEKNSYTIEFQAYGGTEIDDLEFNYNEYLSIPTPLKSDAIFEGWYLDENHANIFDYEYMPAKNFVLHAKWDYINDSNDDEDAKTLAINYHLNGGTNHPDNPEYLSAIAKYVSTFYPIREGYSFQGWYDNPNFLGEKIYMITHDEYNDDIDLYAKWGPEVRPESLIIYYYRSDGDYSGWELWLWPSQPESQEGQAYRFKEFDEEKNMMKFKIDIEGSEFEESTVLGMLVRLGAWESREFEGEGDKFIYLQNVDAEGKVTIFILSGDNIYQNINQFKID